MSNEQLQILTMAKGGMSSEEIAESTGLDAGLVAVVLSQDGEVRRELEKSQRKGRLDAIDDEFTRIRAKAFRALEDILDYGENEGARMSAITLVLKQQLGILENNEGTRNTTTITIVDINNRFEQARERYNKMVSAVPIEAEVVKAA